MDGRTYRPNWRLALVTRDIYQRTKSLANINVNIILEPRSWCFFPQDTRSVDIHFKSSVEHDLVDVCRRSVVDMTETVLVWYSPAKYNTMTGSTDDVVKNNRLELSRDVFQYFQTEYPVVARQPVLRQSQVQEFHLRTFDTSNFASNTRMFYAFVTDRGGWNYLLKGHLFLELYNTWRLKMDWCDLILWVLKASRTRVSLCQKSVERWCMPICAVKCSL